MHPEIYSFLFLSKTTGFSRYLAHSQVERWEK
jgi:hypothetical protein